MNERRLTQHTASEREMQVVHTKIVRPRRRERMNETSEMNETEGLSLSLSGRLPPAGARRRVVIRRSFIKIGGEAGEEDGLASFPRVSQSLRVCALTSAPLASERGRCRCIIRVERGWPPPPPPLPEWRVKAHGARRRATRRRRRHRALDARRV